MLLAGDERSHTQQGNNNAYCQDNTLGWLDWASTPEREALTTFVQRLIALRRAHPSFRRRNFFEGKPIEGDTIKDVSWFRPDGAEMTPEDWQDSHTRGLAMLMSGRGISEQGPRGETLWDDDFLLLLNSHHDEIPFTLPPAGEAGWGLLLDTATEVVPPPTWAQATYPLQSRSCVLLSRAGTRG